MDYVLDKIKSNISKKINKIIGDGLVLPEDFVYPPNSDMGDLSLPCFSLAKKLDKKPDEIVETLIAGVKPDNEILSLKSAGPYLNIILNKNYFNGEVIEKIVKNKKKYGFGKIGQKKKIMIEYSNVNTHKEYHIGHLRNICYGDAVNRILEANGYLVIPVSYVNDFGIHVAKTIWYFNCLLKGDKKDSEIFKELKSFSVENFNAKDFKLIWNFLPEGKKGFILGKIYAKSNTEIEKDKTAKQMIELVMKKIESRRGEEFETWKKTRELSIKQFDEIYKDLGVNFKKYFYESEFIDQGKKMVDELLKKGILKKSQGAIIADLEEYNLGVLVVIRSDGTMLYPVADLPLAKYKIKEFNLDESIYVVDNRQSLYFKQLFKILELMEHKQKMTHLAYDFVKLPTGMMSSRMDNVITYYELKEEILKRAQRETGKRHSDWSVEKIKETAEKISIGAIKFEMIKVGAQNVINFDIEKALSFEGYTAAYIQYVYARIQSIFKKSKFKIQNSKFKVENLKENKEYGLILKIAKYPEIVERAGKNYDPSEIAKYLFELAQIFNDYYHSEPVLKAEEKIKQARLALLSSVAQVIENGLGLLGIEVVEEM